MFDVLAMRWHVVRALGAALVALLLLGSAAPAGAVSGQSTGSEQLSAESAAELVEQIVPDQLERHGIPGAAVTVVAGGEQVFANGYGVADVSSGRPVTAEKTVFAPASVAKLLTATAVMQLVEAGKADLDRDVNAYLDFEIENTYPDHPITLRHLLTHTAGFAARDSGTAAASVADVQPLGAHLAEHLPDRIRPPGEQAVYSNYGMGLAGYVVERQSGLPFHRYVDQNILQPLGMDRTTFAQPAPRDIQANEATSYRLSEGRLTSADDAAYGHMPPHGAGFRSTATDMARFMRALLDDGKGILRPESTREMMSRQFANAPHTPGMGYGFQEYFHNGQRVLVHRGSIPGSFAILALIPDRGIGVYASYNGGDSTAADSVWKMVEGFTDRFAGEAPHHASSTHHALPDVDQYAGMYRSMQIGDTADLGKLAGLTSSVTVTAEPDGTLVTTGPAALGPEETRRWNQIAPGLFREEEGQQTIEFGSDGLLTTTNPAQPLERLAWYEQPIVHLGVIGVSFLVLASAVLGWPVAYAIRRLGNRPSAGPRFTALPGWTTAALGVGSAATLTAMFANFDENQAAFFQGSSPLLSAIGLLPLLGTAASAGAAVTTALAWRNGWWTRAGRLHHTAVVVAAAAYILVAFSYNVPGTP